MKFSNLAFIVTDDCNFNCSYCLPKKEKKYMKRSTIEKAVTFFYPFLQENAYIVFYGGEPLLAFDQIRHAVSLLQEKEKTGKKKLNFSITTNGSLVRDEILDFFNTHGFTMMLSFDGQAQDICREPGSQQFTRELIRRIKKDAYPGIEFSTNSVFTPATVNNLSQSLRSTIEMGVTEVRLSLAEDQPWDEATLMVLENELERVRDFLISYYKERGIIPVINFCRSEPRAEETKVFCCDGGRQRMAIGPGEELWGCLVFHGYLKDNHDHDDFGTYSFGKLDHFIENYETIYPGVLSNYTVLGQDCFFTGKQFCFLCKEVKNCGICPVSAAHATSFIGKIPTWMCGIKQILRKEKEKFIKEIDKIN
jgi:MoaA/NifB/PqqE/SkfB family radical SAM enzyme